MMRISKFRNRYKHGSGFFIAMLMAVTAYDSHAVEYNGSDDTLTYMEEMGKRLFFNEALSSNNNMACSTCHTPYTGGTNGDSETNLGQVAVTGSDGIGVGALKPPTNKYAQFINDEGDEPVSEGLEPFNPSCNGVPCGGAFWNGRAVGDEVAAALVFGDVDPIYEEIYSDYLKYLGPVADQAHASPFTNPVEQNLLDKKAVCERVEETEWGKELYNYAWGTQLDCGDEDKVFARLAVALGAWQMSEDNNRFDSKRDLALKRDYDKNFPLDSFSEEENLGHDLFYAFPPTGAGCRACHRSGDRFGTSPSERYTNDRYFNLGLPYNHEIPNDPEPDPGVWATLDKAEPGDIAYIDDPVYIAAQLGRHKTPTLRNVEKRPDSRFAKAYMHNGWLKTLEQVVHFYNSSDVRLTDAPACIDATTPDQKLAVSTACWLGKTSCDVKDEYGEVIEWTVEQAIAANCWPVPEQDVNVSRGIVGNLRLTADEEAALVVYLKTLSDRTVVREPRRYRSRGFDERRLTH